MLDPGDSLKLDTNSKKDLGGFSAEVIQDLRSSYGPYFRTLNVLWDLYYARPRTPRRTFPWDGASNLVVPVIRTASDALTNKFISRLLSPRDTWTASTQNEDWRDSLPPFMDYINWAARGNIFDIFEPTWSAVSEMTPIGQAIMQLGWRRKIVYRYAPGRANRGRPIKVEVSRGPHVEHVPRDQIMWVPGTEIQDSPVVSRRRWYTRTEFILTAAQAEWFPDAVEHVLENPDERPMERSVAGPEGNRRAGFAGTTDSIDHYEVHELWVDWPTLRSGGADPTVLAFNEQDQDSVPVSVVLTVHPKTGTLLRAIVHPFYFSHKPFYNFEYRKSPGRGDSDGVAHMLEQIQHGTTTIINQSVDALTLANSVNFGTTDRDLLGQRFAPNRPMLVRGGKDAIFPLATSKQIVPDLQLYSALTAIGERLTNVGDPALGRETSIGGHPSPATNTLLMMQQLESHTTPTLTLMRKRMSQLGEDIATLFQQYETDDDGRIEKALGPRDAAVVKDIILPMDTPVSGNVFFDLNSMSEDTNPDRERAAAVLVDQALTGYYSQLLQLAQILNTPQLQNPLVKEIATKAMLAKTESMKRILGASQIDDIEEYVLELKKSGIGGAAQQQLLDQVTGTLEQRLQAQPGAGGAPGGPIQNGSLGGPVPGAVPGAARGSGAFGSGL